MSRSTAEIVADLRRPDTTGTGLLGREAADRLTELDAKNEAMSVLLSGNELAQKLVAVMDAEIGKPTGQPVTEFLRLLMKEERTEASWAYDEGWRACINHLRGTP